MNHLDLSYLILPVTPVILLAVSTSIIFPFFLPLSTISLVSSRLFPPVLIFLVTLSCMRYFSQPHPKCILQSTYVQSPYTKVFTHTPSVFICYSGLKPPFLCFHTVLRPRGHGWWQLSSTLELLYLLREIRKMSWEKSFAFFGRRINKLTFM